MIELTFLGTSQAVPTRKRSHSAALLRYKEELMLIDCGEGTQRQFRIADINPCKLTRLCITHWHGDHILGIPGLLQTLALNGYNKKLHIYGPRGTKEFMDVLFRMFIFVGTINMEIHEVESGVFLKEKDFTLSAFPLNHSARAVGYVFEETQRRKMIPEKLKKFDLKGPIIAELQSGNTIEKNGKKIHADDVSEIVHGKKIAFVWDTAVSDSCIAAAQDADILAIEASYAQDMEAKAEESKHLTSIQAATIAKKAGVKKLILTHMSQRYEKDENRILNEAKTVFKNAVAAKDFLKVTL